MFRWTGWSLAPRGPAAPSGPSTPTPAAGGTGDAGGRHDQRPTGQRPRRTSAPQGTLPRLRFGAALPLPRAGRGSRRQQPRRDDKSLGAGECHRRRRLLALRAGRSAGDGAAAPDRGRIARAHGDPQQLRTTPRPRPFSRPPTSPRPSPCRHRRTSSIPRSMSGTSCRRNRRNSNASSTACSIPSSPTWRGSRMATQLPVAKPAPSRCGARLECRAGDAHIAGRGGTTAVPPAMRRPSNPSGDRLAGGQYVVHREAAMTTPYLPDGAAVARGVALRAHPGHTLPGVTTEMVLGASARDRAHAATMNCVIGRRPQEFPG